MNQVLLAALCFGVSALIALSYLTFSGQPDGEPVTLLIPRGQSLAQVTDLLYEKEIIRHPKLFKYLLRISRGASKVRAGEFQFRTGMSLKAALGVLYSSEPITHAVTIPEGWTIRQIAEILSQAQLIQKQKFLAIALSPETAKKYKLHTPSLEGFLFPDTYTFSKVDGEEKILDTLVNHFFQEFNSKFAEKLKTQGMTMEQIVTLASIVEKETGNPSERPLISSVFHNRLKKRMRLQSDPTTIYGIANFDGNLTKEHLRTPSPYNTYTLPGLPLGPIASPGSAAIAATLNPAQTDYLFFVANNQGSHIFSKTYQEHSRHVSAFQPKVTKRRKF